MAVRHLIVTIHQYWPLELTFQGEEWFTQGDVNAWRGTGWAGMQEQRGQLAAGFQQLADWAPARDRPIFVGEFGSSNNAEMASRARWTRTNRELAEPHGFSWGYWSFGPSFALYDLNANRWNRQLLDALSTEVGPIPAPPPGPTGSGQLPRPARPVRAFQYLGARVLA